jgi:imidazolonepropionase-like amidohydrolase
VDVHGKWLAPAFIDSHVHLRFDPVAPELARRGVAAAVDLAAPEPFLSEAARPKDLRVLAAGPMLTSPGGYPLDAWGPDGYGVGCPDAPSAVQAVDRLNAEGAALIKVALPDLPDAALAAAVGEAHRLGLVVAAHAVDADSVARAAAAGVDVLAHTPVEPLAADAASAWRGRTVIATLGAFGGQPSTLRNLASLRAAGAVVLYGTDLGNTPDAGIQQDELAFMQAAGMTGAEILDAGTKLPAAFWHLDDLGAIAAGKRASILILDEDPVAHPGTLAHPRATVVGGTLAR